MESQQRNVVLNKTRRVLGLFAIGLAIMACGSDPATPLPTPGVNPEIINLGDGNFQFQVTAMSNYSTRLQYTWANADSYADVDQSGTITGGTALLRLLDADGTEVYSGDLSEGGSSVSSAGTPGDWTIVIDPTSASGDVNFRVDSRPTE